MFALLNQNQEREEVRNVYNSAAQLRILASNILHAPVNKVAWYNGVPGETQNKLTLMYVSVWRMSYNHCTFLCGGL